jgi:ribonuclease E
VLEDENTDTGTTPDQAGQVEPAPRPRRRRAATRPAGPPEPVVDAPAVEVAAVEAPAEAAAVDVVAEAPVVEPEPEPGDEPEGGAAVDAEGPAGQEPARSGSPTSLFAAPAFATPAPERRPRRRASAAAGPPAADIFTAPPALPDFDELLPPPVAAGDGEEPAGRTRTGRARRSRRRTPEDDIVLAPTSPAATTEPADDNPAGPGTGDAPVPADDAPAPARATRSRSRRKPATEEPVATPEPDDTVDQAAADDAAAGDQASEDEAPQDQGAEDQGAETGAEVEDDDGRPRRGGRSRRRRGGRGRGASDTDAGPDDGQASDEAAAAPSDDDSPVTDDDDTDDQAGSDADGDDESGGSRSSRRRRRRRRRSGGGDADLSLDPDDPPGTVVRIRESRADEVTKLKGSTRLEAKRQRRRDGRGASRKRTVITEAEFLTRRESVDRTLLVREGEDRTEIAVLEDGVLVEHHVTRASQQSMIGNVYLGKVQNVLPSMEAAFVDIGRGRNAVLYAGEVNWDAFGMTGGSARKIEDALKPGDPVLAQVSKDPIGHKGARLTAQISLPGRYLVYVPGSSMTGISRKLPENERTRLKKVLRRVVPEDAGVIVRTAAEGASEAELERDVARLKAQWEDIEAKSKAVQAPARLYSEPDLAIKVVRDVFNEDFTRLVVSGDDTWDTLDGYVRHVAPDLAERMSRWSPEADAEQDLFRHHRIDEQIAKALDRKVWLPSGGSLVIDRTEAMTVVDVNTGKYTGNGGNLEETVTRNNLEAAEEIVRQLRLRDIGGIIVVDFIDMVLESNRNLVLRRLVECLGRDRTKHQVAEVTSLGLVQLTRKRVGSGLLESFSTPCEHCQGRGLITHSEPIGAGNEAAGADAGRGGDSSRGGPRRRGGRGGQGS